MAVLAAAEAVSLAELSPAQLGRSVTVAGARLSPDPRLPGDALLDDGSAVVPIVVSDDAPPMVRSALSCRFIVASGTVATLEGFVTLLADELRDLRQLDREWKALSRR